MPPKTAPQKTKSKSRVGVRLREGVGLSKARNRSADLIKLQEQFFNFVKKVKSLTNVLKNHHGSMVQLAKTRVAVAQEVSKLAHRSPLEECVAEMPSPEKPSDQVCSYASIHAQVAEKSKSYISKYAQFVVEYAIEWERVITGRISVGIKKAELLRRDLDHYQQKVESLRQSANQYMAKGKQVDSKTADRLSRNEEKFMKAKQEYDVFATDLCILIEEVTDRGWKDLHPLLIKLAQFDMTMSDDESKMMGTLSQVVSQLKSVASSQGLESQARLKDIEHKKPSELNTGPAGGTMRLEDGNADGSVFGTSLLSQALPPGSVGAQGSGGFPVQIGEMDRSAPPRNSSFGSYDSAPNALTTTSYGTGNDWASSTYNVSNTQRTMRSAPNSAGAPSTMDILQMSSAAAPPPTMDQLNEANSPYPMARSASGGLPPLGPSGYSSRGGGDNDSAYGSNYGGSNYGGGSAYGDPYASDTLSAYSGASAPAPAAPPPPPPPVPTSAPPPPPAPMSMYPPPSQPSWNAYPQQQQNYGQQQQQPNFGQPSYGQQQQQPNNFGQPSYGQQPAYGQPQQQQQQQQWGQQQPQQNNQQQGTNPFGPGPGTNTNPFG